LRPVALGPRNAKRNAADPQLFDSQLSPGLRANAGFRGVDSWLLVVRMLAGKLGQRLGNWRLRQCGSSALVTTWVATLYRENLERLGEINDSPRGCKKSATSQGEMIALMLSEKMCIFAAVASFG